MTAKQEKTNVMRLLDAAETPYTPHEYDTADGQIDARSMARKIGKPEEQVFKTLVTQSNTGEFFVFVIPGNAELDLKKAAKASSMKKIEMIPSRTLLPVTGYIHGGCSPLGMKKRFRTFLDETAMLFDTICVSGGRIGFCVEVAPPDLVSLVSAKYAPLTVE